MKASRALIYKDWHHARWFLVAGLFLFVGIPLLEAVGMQYKVGAFRTDMPEGFVLGFGSLFAIFMAAGGVCPELGNGLYSFWRARPVALWRWVLIKYFAGLFVVLLVCVSSMALELISQTINPLVYRDSEFGWAILTYHTYTIILMYSIAFLVSCVVRKTTHAAILSAAIGLVIYFIPVLMSALEPVSVLNMIERGKAPRFEIVSSSEWTSQAIFGKSHETWGYWFGSPHRIWMRLPWDTALIFHYYRGYWEFVITMLTAGIVVVGLTLLCLKHCVIVRMRQKLLAFSLGAIAVLIFAVGSFALGSNLTCQQSIELVPKCEKHMYYLNGASSGNCGLAIYDVYDREAKKMRPGLIKQYEIVNDKVIVCDYSLEDVEMYSMYGRNAVEYSHDRPGIVWTLQSRCEKLNDTDAKRTLWLVTLELQKESKQVKVLGKLKLGEHISNDNSTPGGCSIKLYGDKIYAYVYGKLYAIDVSNPAAEDATLLDEKYGGPVFGESGSGGKMTRTLRLFKDESLSYQQRVQVTVGLMDYYEIMTGEDKTFVGVSGDSIKVFKLVSSVGDQAAMESDTFRRPRPLERVMDLWPKDACLKDGLLYVLTCGGPGQGVTVFDVSMPGRVRKIAHYAAPDERFRRISLLEDGRLLAIGDSLHIVLPPASR